LLGGEAAAAIEVAGSDIFDGGVEGEALGAAEAGESDQGTAESAVLGVGSDEELFDPAGRMGRKEDEEGEQVPVHPHFRLLSVVPQKAFAKSGPGMGMTARGKGVVPSVVPTVDQGLEISGGVGSQQTL